MLAMYRIRTPRPAAVGDAIAVASASRRLFKEELQKTRRKMSVTDGLPRGYKLYRGERLF